MIECVLRPRRPIAVHPVFVIKKSVSKICLSQFKGSVQEPVSSMFCQKWFFVKKNHCIVWYKNWTASESPYEVTAVIGTNAGYGSKNSQLLEITVFWTELNLTRTLTAISQWCKKFGRKVCPTSVYRHSRKTISMYKIIHVLFFIWPEYYFVPYT